MNKKRRTLKTQAAKNTKAEPTALPDERVVRCMALVREFFPERRDAMRWLKTPHPDFAGRTALDVLEAQPDALLNLLSNARDGIPL